MPFVAGKSACPSAPSRAPGFGVHWSEAEALARKRRTDQAQGCAGKGRKTRTLFRGNLGDFKGKLDWILSSIEQHRLRGSVVRFEEIRKTDADQAEALLRGKTNPFP
jgi:hypothetical protein